MKNTPTSKRALSFTSLLLSVAYLSCSSVSAMEPIGAVEPLAKTSQQYSTDRRDQLHDQELSLMKKEPKRVSDIFVDNVSSRCSSFFTTRPFFKYRLVCKEWAAMVNPHRNFAYHILLTPNPGPYYTDAFDPKKHLPPYSKGVPSTLFITGYEDANMGVVYSAINKLKRYPVDIIQWHRAQQPANRRPISADNVNYTFDLIADSFDPETLKTLDFRYVSLQASTNEFVDLLTKFPKLEHLVLRNAEITPENIEIIINVLPESLVSLDLTEMNNGSKGFAALIKKLPQLKNLKLLGIQIGENVNRGECKLGDFYGDSWGSYGERKTKDLMKTYNGKGEACRRQIVEISLAVGQDLMDRFKATVAPLEKLEFIVLN